jgi:hypothetical protein
MLELARSRVPGAEFVHADVPPLPFADRAGAAWSSLSRTSSSRFKLPPRVDLTLGAATLRVSDRAARAGLSSWPVVPMIGERDYASVSGGLA